MAFAVSTQFREQVNFLNKLYQRFISQSLHHKCRKPVLVGAADGGKTAFTYIKKGFHAKNIQPE